VLRSAVELTSRPTDHQLTIELVTSHINGRSVPRASLMSPGHTHTPRQHLLTDLTAMIAVTSFVCRK